MALSTPRSRAAAETLGHTLCFPPSTRRAAHSGPLRPTEDRTPGGAFWPPPEPRRHGAPTAPPRSTTSRGSSGNVLIQIANADSRSCRCAHTAFQIGGRSADATPMYRMTPSPSTRPTTRCRGRLPPKSFMAPLAEICSGPVGSDFRAFRLEGVRACPMVARPPAGRQERHVRFHNQYQRPGQKLELPAGKSGAGGDYRTVCSVPAGFPEWPAAA